MRKSKLYIFSNGRVAAIDKRDGSIIWETNFKEYGLSAIGYAIGQIVEDGDKLYLAVYGHLLCLSAADGSLIWKNELKGWGYNFVSIASKPNDEQAAYAAQQAGDGLV